LKKISILYVCNEDRATTYQRILALREMNVDLSLVYTYILNERITLVKKLYRAILFRFGIFPERNRENKAIINSIKTNTFDILFIEKGLSIKPSTLVQAKKLQPALKIISYTLDDMMNSNNASFNFRKSVKLYDMLFTNKKYNVAELKNIGAKNVYYFTNAYSQHVHRPIIVTEAEQLIYGYDVSFIGSYEYERVEKIRFLADNGIRIKVWGWGKGKKKSNMDHPNIIMTGKYVYEDEYAKVVCSTKVNLCFLRKENRDTETTRSIEIPACRGFMLAERTKEHLDLFEEGSEASYFSSKEEMLEKIKYYLKHDEERTRIALNAYKRCIKSRYDYKQQLVNIFSIVLGYDAISNN